MAQVGCSNIRLKTVDTTERVLSSHKRLAPSASVRMRARVDGTVLLLEAEQACKLVVTEEVEVVEERGPDEDLIEEFIVLGVAAVPLVSGIVILADAPNVYDDDRNQRTYNPIGRDGAYAAGTVLTSLGGLIALIPLIELLRIAGSGEVITSTTERDGKVLAPDVPCEGVPRPIRTSVVLRVGGVNLATPGTDGDGVLELDLAEAVPPDLARRAVVIQVIVDERVVAEIDPRPIVEAQQARASQIATEPNEATTPAPPEEQPSPPPEGQPPRDHDSTPDAPGPETKIPIPVLPKGGAKSSPNPCRQECREACRNQNDNPNGAAEVLACSNKCIEWRCK
jgi:hypothetical protein